MKEKDINFLVGIDEVGRGPLAGPVSVGVVVCQKKFYKKICLDKDFPSKGKDSKKLSVIFREKYVNVFQKIAKENKIFFKIKVVHISNLIIDKKGINFAISLAIKRAINFLKLNPRDCQIFLDGGLKAPLEFLRQETVIKGDEKIPIISWASIIAKVSRDKIMTSAHKKHPSYQFDLHKGYGTKKHLEAIHKNGLSVLHRKTFCKKI